MLPRRSLTAPGSGFVGDLGLWKPGWVAGRGTTARTFACVLRDLRKELCQKGALTRLPWAESWNCCIDEVLPVDGHATSERACDLPEVTKTSAGALIDQCLSRGLIPNLSRGKTEIVLVRFGAKSRAARAEAFRDADPCLRVHSLQLADANVRLVGQYRHLGGLIHHSGRLLRVRRRHRIMLAHESFQKHKTRVFVSPAVPAHAKATLYESLVLTVLLHGAGTWMGMDTPTLQTLNKAHVLMVAKMLRPHCTFDDALHLGYLGVPSMQILLHVARLRQLVPSIRLRIGEFWALVHWDSTWISEVRQ